MKKTATSLIGLSLSFRDRKGSNINFNNRKKMTRKAIIFDLDNTVYAVASIAPKLFRSLYNVIEEDGSYQGNIEDVKEAIQRKPFQVVAEEFQFSDTLTQKGLALLMELEYDDIMKPFDDYLLTKKIDCLKFLVTTGFKKLQESKIKQMSLEDDFTAYFIVDPSISELTKKDVFQSIAEQYHLKPEDILVVGDDIHSEIKAAEELGIDAVVYDYDGTHEQLLGYDVITHYAELEKFI